MQVLPMADYTPCSPPAPYNNKVILPSLQKCLISIPGTFVGDMKSNLITEIFSSCRCCSITVKVTHIYLTKR